jgi:hypothetical protein
MIYLNDRIGKIHSLYIYVYIVGGEIEIQELLKYS